MKDVPRAVPPERLAAADEEANRITGTTNGLQNKLYLGGGDRDVNEGMKDLVNGQKVVVLTYDPGQVTDRDRYRDYLKTLGAKSVEVVLIENVGDANEQKNVDKINNATVVFMPGGHQNRYERRLERSKVLAAIEERYGNEQLSGLGGTSAGAMILAPTASSPDGKINVFNPPELEGWTVDTHFGNHIGGRKRFKRLSQFSREHGVKAIGVDGSTAFTIERNRIGTVTGENFVYILTPKEDRDGQYTEVIRLKAGDTYDLNTGKHTGTRYIYEGREDERSPY